MTKMGLSGKTLYLTTVDVSTGSFSDLHPVAVAKASHLIILKLKEIKWHCQVCYGATVINSLAQGAAVNSAPMKLLQ